MARTALVNLARLDNETLSDIVSAAHLPAGEIRLIVGDPRLSSMFQGITIPRTAVSSAGNIYGLEDFLGADWDCGVIIGRKWAERQPEFPVYFAFLLGHELGHATTVLTNPGVTIYEELIVQFISNASNRRDWRWDEFPHEIRYDQFGIAVAEAVYGRSALEDEFSNILGRGLADDPPRLQRAITLPPRRDLGGLQEELAEFSRPYKDNLLALWQEHRRLLRFSSGLQQLDALWNAT